MNSLWQSRIIWMIVLWVAAPLLVSCTPDANAQIISPQLGTQLVAQAQGGEIVLEPTPAPPKLAELTPEQIYAGLPEELVTATQNADPADGPNVALLNACSGCHAVEAGVTLAGPTWVGLGDRAVERALATGSPGPAEYLHQSIINPNAYVVPGYSPGIMLQNLSDTLSTEDMATLIAYILSLRQE